MQVTWLPTFGLILCSSILASAKQITTGPSSIITGLGLDTTGPSSIVARPSSNTTDPSDVSNIIGPSLIATRSNSIIASPSSIITDPSEASNIIGPSLIATRSNSIITRPSSIITRPSSIVISPSSIITSPNPIITSPIAVATGPSPMATGQRTLKPEQLEAIAPDSSTCKGAPKPRECRTATEAAPIISNSFKKYNITSPAEQAALVGLIVFESDGFKYNRNIFPGIPGQGTRNMQSPRYNALYAKSIPALKNELVPIAGNPTAVLDLLLREDAHDFGSAAWFLKTQCSPKIRNALRSGGEDGWRKYITSCVGAKATEERLEIWERAVEELVV